MRKILGSLFLTLSTLCYSNDNTMEVLISSKEIAEKIQETAAVLNNDYRGKDLTILMILKGAICVTSDLIRHIEVPFSLDFIKASSYGQNGTMSKELTITHLEHLDIEGRDVLIVDDIFDTGKTLAGVMKIIEGKKPKSIKTLMLLVKNVPHTTDYFPDYVLFEIPNRFVIGYGLDYKELYRGLPDICAFLNDTPPF